MHIDPQYAHLKWKIPCIADGIASTFYGWAKSNNAQRVHIVRASIQLPAHTQTDAGAQKPFGCGLIDERR